MLKNLEIIYLLNQKFIVQLSIGMVFMFKFTTNKKTI